MAADELWQEYNQQAEPIGSGLPIQTGRSGVLHGAAHVWIWRRDGDRQLILLQKRAADKPTWPGYLDISAAGHMHYGETPLQTATREAQEELGLTVAPTTLHFICTYHQYMPFGQIIENEFIWMYSLELVAEKQFAFTDGEVTATRWVPLEQLKQLIAQQSTDDELLVPQRPAYSAELLQGLSLHFNGTL